MFIVARRGLCPAVGIDRLMMMTVAELPTSAIYMVHSQLGAKQG